MDQIFLGRLTARGAGTPTRPARGIAGDRSAGAESKGGAGCRHPDNQHRRAVRLGRGSGHARRRRTADAGAGTGGFAAGAGGEACTGVAAVVRECGVSIPSAVFRSLYE